MDCIYKFDFPDRKSEEFVVSFNTDSLTIQSDRTTPSPSWTALDFQQCPHCSLDPKSISHCPLAVNIADIIDRFAALISHHDTTLTVTTDDRTYICPTTVQNALSSLLGLVIAASGCPHTEFLRPMAHFHLPVSDGREVIYRAVGMYFIGQYFRKNMGKSADLDLSGLVALYENVERVNTQTIEKIRTVTSKDASVNAMTVLYYTAQAMSMAIEDQLGEIRHLWSAYTSEHAPA